MPTFYHGSIPNTSGIYRITCTVTGKIYVGSAINLRQRRKSHFGDLQRNKHRNSKLQRAWNKYGPDAFIFEILELVLIPELLTAREQYWFSKLKPFGSNGFNLDRVAGSSLGRVVSQSSREKSRATQRGRPSTFRGKKHTPEAIEQMKRSRRGKKQSEEHKRNAAQTRIGKKRSPETCEKIRLANLGHPVNPESIAKRVAKTRKTLIMIDPSGTEHVVHGIRPFCKEHGLAISSIMEVARGKQRQHRGWTARYPETDAG